MAMIDEETRRREWLAAITNWLSLLNADALNGTFTMFSGGSVTDFEADLEKEEKERIEGDLILGKKYEDLLPIQAEFDRLLARDSNEAANDEGSPP